MKKGRRKEAHSIEDGSSRRREGERERETDTEQVLLKRQLRRGQGRAGHGQGRVQFDQVAGISNGNWPREEATVCTGGNNK